MTFPEMISQQSFIWLCFATCSNLKTFGFEAISPLSPTTKKKSNTYRTNPSQTHSFSRSEIQWIKKWIPNEMRIAKKQKRKADYAQPSNLRNQISNEASLRGDWRSAYFLVKNLPEKGLFPDTEYPFASAVISTTEAHSVAKHPRICLFIGLDFDGSQILQRKGNFVNHGSHVFHVIVSNLE